VTFTHVNNSSRHSFFVKFLFYHVRLGGTDLGEFGEPNFWTVHALAFRIYSSSVKGYSCFGIGASIKDARFRLTINVVTGGGTKMVTKKENVQQGRGTASVSNADDAYVAGGVLDKDNEARARTKARTLPPSVDTSHLSDARYRRMSQCPDES
jgi:hypothetical protein